MHDRTDEQLIMAYVDGEIAPHDRCGVERRLRFEPALIELEQGFRESCKLVRAAFAAEIERPVPEKLLGLFAQRESSDVGPLPENMIGLFQFAKQPALRRVRQYAVLAACLVLAVGLAAGTMITRQFDAGISGATVRPALLTVADPGTYRLLDRTPSQEVVAWNGERTAASGRLMPLVTFRSRSGQYCRQFVQSVATGDRIFAVACRDASGAWSPVVAMMAPPLKRSSPDAYVPAAGAPKFAFMEAVDAMLAAPPLDEKTEWSLLKAWSGR